MFRKSTKPLGQRTEITSPYLAILGAMVIIGVGVFAFWPDSSTVRTDATANLPADQKGTSTAPGSPPQPQ
jgi:hypothetical protein